MSLCISCIVEGFYAAHCLIRDFKNDLSLNEDFLIKVQQYKEENHLNWETEILCQEYETIYTDKGLLIKTLEEHDVKKLEFRGEDIYCRIEEFKLKFYREPNMPYKMEIIYSRNKDVEEVINNLDSEYNRNIQEATYVKIKARLAKNNLQIDNEEVLEDDSIMLTVNLD